ncbi:MAG: hypothetical protein HQL24_05775 [Candidatus Omnitrophica bacterium]|nr:hypothetical protein [Candidatus Omnitrophota bacterium]
MKKIFLLFLVFIFLSECSYADIALVHSSYKHTMSITSGSPVTSYLTTIATIDSGSNQMLVVGVSAEIARTTGTITFGTVSYNGTLMTQVTTASVVATGNGSVDGVALYYLQNPAVGTNNYVASTVSASTGIGTINSHKILAISLSGVNQAAPEANNSATNNSASASVNLTTLTNNAWVLDIVCEDLSTATWTAGGGQSPVLDIGGNQMRAAMSYKPVATAGATTMSWAISGSYGWAIIAASFAPFVAASNASVSGATSMTGITSISF